MTAKYCLVVIQTNLFDPESIQPIGVIVEGWNDEKGQIALVIKEPEPTTWQVNVPISSVLYENAHILLSDRIQNATSDEIGKRSALEWLADSYRFNLRVEYPVSTLVTCQSAHELAKNLFIRLVALLTNYHGDVFSQLLTLGEPNSHYSKVASCPC